MPRNETEPLMTVGDVAARLNVSPKTIRNWVFRDKIPSLRVLGAVRFDPAEIDRWLQEQNAGSRRSVA